MDNKALLERFFKAENERDWETYAACLHEDVMWFIHAEDGHTPVAGREEYLETVKKGAEKGGSFTCERMDVSRSGARIAALIVSEDGGRSLGVFDFEDGLIRWEHEFLFD